LWNNAEELAEGVFEYRRPEVLISEDKISASVKVGESCSGSFFLEGLGGKEVRGNIYSSSMRMEFESSDFCGIREEIFYTFDSRGLAEGQDYTGEICVVCNCGEYVIPFSINVMQYYENSSLGEIKNLFHFANLASSRWDEAFRLFKSPAFSKIITDREHLAVYEVLSKPPVKEQYMEEFLIAVRKKHIVNIEIDRSAKSFDHITGMIREKIIIKKEAWGYVNVDIWTDAPFIRLEKQHITTDDFLGSIFELGYIIDEDKLYNRKNFGRIYFATPYQKLAFEVTVSQAKPRLPETLREYRSVLRHLAELYLAFRLKKTSLNQWVRDSQAAAERLEALIEGGNGSGSFFSEEELQRFALLKEQFGLAEKNRKAADCIHLFFPGLDQDPEESRDQSLKRLEMMFAEGCRSPFLYLEAYSIIKDDPLLMIRIGAFELQVLFWAVKNQQMTKDVAGQVFGILRECRNTGSLLQKIIEECYKELPETDSLSAVCSFLIRNNRVGKKYFRWYEEGIEKDLKITRLYEYYMDSIDFGYKGQLPQAILMYFVYNNSLDSRKKAYLYASVMRYREENPVMYRNYWKHIERFMMDELKKKRINEDLAYIYETGLGPETITAEVREPLSEIIFTYRLECTNSRIRSVVVTHGQFQGESVYPVSDGRAYLQIYTENHGIILQDADGSRFVDTVPYTLTRLIREEKLDWKCFDLEEVDVRALIYLYAAGRLKEESFYNSFSLFNRAIDSPVIKPAYKKRIIGQMIHEIYDRKETRVYSKYLMNLDYSMLTISDRGRAVEILIISEENDKAFEIIRVYGAEGIGVKLLLKLCARKIYLNNGEYDPFLLKLCSYVFRKGKYESAILKYLEKYYEGPTDVLSDLWKAAECFEIDDEVLTEKLILQSLYAGYRSELKEVFDSYYRRGGKEKVILAYLSYHAHAAFMKDRKISDEIYGFIAREYEAGEPMNDVCRLALLKHYAAKKELNGKEKIIARFLLREYMSREMCFGFFKDFEESLIAPYYIDDRTFVEYKADPANRVVIHYLIEGMEEDGDRYTAQVMENLHGGIFVKHFILFYGEVLRYYISEETPTGEELIKSGKIRKTEISMESQESRFELINDMMVSRSLQDENTLARLVDKYEKQKYIVEHIFKMM